MAIVHHRALEDAVAEYAEIAGFWFSKKFHDENAFEDRLRTGLNFYGGDQYADNKIQLTRSPLSLFSAELFQAMICGGRQFKPILVSILWDRLVSAGVVVKSFVHINGNPFADHQLNQQALAAHLNDGTFINLFVLPARLPEIYAHAVAAVDVLTRTNDASRGTGFIVSHLSNHYFITCKHNVDPNYVLEIKEVKTASGNILPTSGLVLSEHYDIAAVRLVDNVCGPSFCLSDDAQIFDEVFTLGYPLVPFVDPILVGHRGEVNGHTQLYADQCPVILISNLVSPGNSGGPVLTRAGRCVGMTTSWLEGEIKSNNSQIDIKFEKMRFSAALPASLLRQFIESI